MAIQTQEQIDAFKNVALSQGYDPKEVESIVAMGVAANKAKQAEAEAASQKEMQLYEQKLQMQNKYNPSAVDKPWTPESDAVLQRQLYLDKMKKDQGITSTGDLSEAEATAVREGAASIQYDEKGNLRVVPKEKSVDPLQWAADNQAMKYLTGRDKDARFAQAAAMQKLGVDKYFQASALPDLLTDKELTAREAATGLLNSASSIFSQVSNREGSGAQNVQGVGPLGRFRPGFLTNTEGKTLKQDITNLTAAKMKEISGAAISDREVQRLSKALPQVGDMESVILTKAKNIADSIEVGLQMQEYAKRERLTLDEAYKKYGSQAFQDKGQPVPSWIKGGSAAKPGLDIGSKNTGTQVGRFTIQVE